MTSKALFLVCCYFQLSLHLQRRRRIILALLWTITNAHAHKLKILSKSKSTFSTNNNRTMHFLGYGTSSMTALLRYKQSLSLFSPF
uniref:Putative ovule protein n=1 Tax=Solanum chacoense TaxID=4108 RepID=A0A0V0GJV2_SOLCH